jgi:sugar-specific transcriptional regulator TrmB
MQELKSIGFTDGEAKVYMALLRSGPSGVNRIYETTKIHRRNIYDILNRLISRGLVTFVVEDKKRKFQITDPNRIGLFLGEQRKIIDEKEKTARILIPKLKKQFSSSRPAEAEIYRGFEGIKTLWEDTLNYEEVLILGGGAYVYFKMPRYWISYNRKRVKKHVRMKILARREIRDVETLKEKFVESRLLPRELSGPPNVIWIYGNKVVNVLWTDTPVAFVLSDKNISDSYRKYFQFLWKRSAQLSS